MCPFLWAEAHHLGGGWVIGNGGVYNDEKYQDEVESESLYNLLEKQVVPMFYDRRRDGIPHRWVDQMRIAMRQLSLIFNMKRMVHEYSEKLYLPAHKHWQKLNQDSAQRATALAHWKSRIRSHWSELRIDWTEDGPSAELGIGELLIVKAQIHLGALSPEDVSVQLYHGRLDPNGNLSAGEVVEMTCVVEVGGGAHHFEGTIRSSETGLHGYTLRILPSHDDLVHALCGLPELIFWSRQ